ncbi:MAG: hypothetical protein U0610_07420 [bacterium]
MLASVPGFFVDERPNYSYAGARGFLRPGDYNARVLILVDGHRLNEPVFDSASLGARHDGHEPDRARRSRGPAVAGRHQRVLRDRQRHHQARSRDLEGAEAGGTVGLFETYGARLAADRDERRVRAP